MLLNLVRSRAQPIQRDETPALRAEVDGPEEEVLRVPVTLAEL
jgi:hypothetical protein